MRMLSRTVLVSLATAWLVSSAAGQGLSTSIMRPSPVDSGTGVIAGSFPGGEGATSYYLAVDLQPGQLMTQLRVSGRQNTPKRIDFELLDASARTFASAYVMAESEARRDLTRNYAIDAAGRYVVRLVVDGKETNAPFVASERAGRPCPINIRTAPTIPRAGRRTGAWKSSSIRAASLVRASGRH